MVIDALRDGSPWNDDPVELDHAADARAFAPWPGVVFVLPLED